MFHRLVAHLDTLLDNTSATFYWDFVRKSDGGTPTRTTFVAFWALVQSDPYFTRVKLNDALTVTGAPVRVRTVRE